MFLPAIPAYVWLWPNVAQEASVLVQSAVYLYLLAGCLIIGLRRWNGSQLGLNREGIGISLLCGTGVVAAMALGRLATDLPLGLQPLTFERLLSELLFYFGLVGFVEELLFRGLIYRVLDEWRGAGLAILGSALAFGLYHAGWAGSLGVLSITVLGLVFGLIRWRAGGILGLIVVHGLFDVVSKEMYPSLTVEQAAHVSVVNPFVALVGDVLMLSIVVYLWKLHPRVQRRRV